MGEGGERGEGREREEGEEAGRHTACAAGGKKWGTSGEGWSTEKKRDKAILSKNSELMVPL